MALLLPYTGFCVTTKEYKSHFFVFKIENSKQELKGFTFIYGSAIMRYLMKCTDLHSC